MVASLSASLERLVLRYFEDLDTSFSLMCALLWRHGEIEALVRLDCRPEDYETPERYLRSVAALAFVKKLQGLLDNEESRAAATISKWWEGELSCYRANQRLVPYIPELNLERDPDVQAHIESVRKIVAELIGYRPPLLAEGRHGPGATYSNRGLRTTVPHKMSTDPTLTSGAIWYLPQFFGTAWGRYVASERELSFVKGNRFTRVPKTSVVDRSIAIEPSINVFFQLALGGQLRERLRRSHGWDLDSAQTIHRRVAEEASRTREFATLDLSNASDTVAYNLVKLLLPRSWFEALDSLRSPFTSHPTDPTKWVKLEKFSSMGNGYTFELETVIFSALAIHTARSHGHIGVLGKDVFVFGDDIIIPDDCVRGMTAILNYFGFSLNREKSFSGSSPFRESCGADFYNGVDVRPSYLKKEPENVQDCIGIANRISATQERIRLMGGIISDSAWRCALSGIPLPYRSLRGPKALGDAVVWAPEEQWRVRWRHSIRYVRCLKSSPKRVVSFGDFPPDVVLACATYGTGNIGTPVGGRVPVVEGVIPRTSSRSFTIGFVPFS